MLADSPDVTTSTKTGYLKRSHRNVSINWLGASIFALLATAALYVTIVWAGDSAGWTYLHRYFVGDMGLPIIQVLITYLFFQSFVFLIYKQIMISRQDGGFAQASELLASAREGCDDRGHIELSHADKFLHDAIDSPYLIVGRLAAGFRRLRNTGTSSGVDDVLRTISDVDRDMSQTSYTFVRFSATIIPVLGFLGTVFGISLAIIKFTDILARAQSFTAIRPQLGEAISSLGLAFNTTLLALLCSGIVLAGMAYVQKKEEDLLSAIERFCIENLIVHLRPPSMSDNLERAIRDSAVQVTTAVETQTSHLKESSARVEGTLNTMSKDLRKEATSVGKSLGKDIQSLQLSIKKVADNLDNIPATASQDEKTTVATIVKTFERFAGEASARLDSFEDLLKQVRDVQGKPAARLEVLVTDLQQAVAGLSSLPSLIDAAGSLENDLGDLVPMRSDVHAIQNQLETLSERIGIQFHDMLMPLFKITILGHRIKSHEISDMAEAEAILTKLMKGS